MQGVKLKNYFFSFSPLFCKPQLLLLIWAASMWHRATAWLTNLRVCFSFFAFNTECQSSGPRMTCALVLELYGSMVVSTIHSKKSYSCLVAQLSGVLSRDWISQRWHSRARSSSGATTGVRTWLAQTLDRSSGTRQLRNWCEDAIYYPHSQRTSGALGFPKP